MSEHGFYGISVPAPNMIRVGEVVYFVDAGLNTLAALIIGLHGDNADLQVFEVGRPPRQELNVPLDRKHSMNGTPQPRTWHWIGR